MARSLIVFGHPHRDSFNGALASAYAAGLQRTGADVDWLHLGEMRFDPLLRPHDTEQLLESDLLAARAAIEAADHVAWFFPTWWAGPPALVKGFIDRTFLSGWAFRYRERNPLPEGLLRGRSARLVTTMDSPGFWYTLWHGRSVHTAVINATLRFVGFGPVRSTTIFGVRKLAPRDLARWIARMELHGIADGRRLLAKPRLQGRRPTAPLAEKAA